MGLVAQAKAQQQAQQGSWALGQPDASCKHGNHRSAWPTHLE